MFTFRVRRSQPSSDRACVRDLRPKVKVGKARYGSSEGKMVFWNLHLRSKSSVVSLLLRWYLPRTCSLESSGVKNLSASARHFGFKVGIQNRTWNRYIYQWHAIKKQSLCSYPEQNKLCFSKHLDLGMRCETWLEVGPPLCSLS
jgi:hypothetical protein